MSFSKPLLRRNMIRSVCRPAHRSVVTGVSESLELNDIKPAITAYPRSVDEMPGPEGLPILGTLPTYFRKANRGRMHEVQREFHAKHGKLFMEKLGYYKNVCIADPEIVEELFRCEGKHPDRPPYEAWVLYKKQYKVTDGLTTGKGDTWHKYRGILSQQTLRPKAVAMFTDNLNEVVTSLVDRIRYVKNEEKNNNVVQDLPNELYKWAMESIGTVLFETRLGCLEPVIEPRVQGFIDAVADMFLTGHEMMVGAKISQYLNTKTWKRHVKSWETINSISEELINKKLAEIKRRMDNEEEPIAEGKCVELLTYLLASKKLTIPEIYANVSEILLAGLDTTSNALGFALHLLSTNHRVQKKLHDEVSRVLGGRICTYDDLESMKYLKSVVKETLRLYPVIPINARITSEDIVLRGYKIPKGTCLMLNTYTMSRDESIFTKADEFVPERWLRETAKEFHPFSTIPFGFGVRSCIGKRIAELELYLSITRIIQHFQLKTNENFAIDPRCRTVLTPGKNLPVEFVDR